MRQHDMLSDENWGVIESLLPEGWQEKVKELGAYQRKRAFGGAAELLRTLLIHVAEGQSFRVTAALAGEGGLADLSDVALNKRLRRAGAWLLWMAAGVSEKWLRPEPAPSLDRSLRVRLADGTAVQEPGSKGTSWRIHYSLELPSLHCDEVKVTGPEEAESFSQFTVQPGDLWLGDRAYAKRSGIYHVVSQGGDVPVRTGVRSMVLNDEQGQRFDVLAHLRRLRYQHVRDWPVTVPYKGSQIMGRIVGVRKSEEATRRDQKRIQRENSRKGRKTRPETLEAARYTFVFTTLDQSIAPETILTIYRIRWQIELAFKRLKSLLGLGRLHNQNPESAKAWLYGKLLTACLLEALAVAATRFFPWGYPVGPSTAQTTESLERTRAHVSILSPGTASPQQPPVSTEAVAKTLSHSPGKTEKTPAPDGGFAE